MSTLDSVALPEGGIGNPVENAQSLAAMAREVERLKGLVSAERAGRASAERALREAINSKLYDEDSGTGYPCYPVGTVRGPYRQRRGAGRQGLLVPDARAEVILSPSVAYETLEGLSDYSHVYLVFIFHENTISVPTVASDGSGKAKAGERKQRRGDDTSPERSRASNSNVWGSLGRSFAAKVSAPGLYGAKTGVFATRSPHRPNALGLSLVKLVSVDVRKRTIVVSGCDLIEGTPVVDIKPALPVDCPVCLGGILGTGDREGGGQHSCAHDGSASGEPVSAAEGHHAEQSTVSALALPHGPAPDPTQVPHPLAIPASTWQMRLPSWVASNLVSAKRLPVSFAPAALEALRSLCTAGKLAFYRGGSEPEADAFVRSVIQTLSLDIRAVHRGRGTAGKGERGTSPTSAPTAPAAAPDQVAPSIAGSGDVASSLTAGGEPAAAGSPPAPAPGSDSGFQRYELYYDAAYIVFTVRPGTDAGPHASVESEGELATGGSAGQAASSRVWCCVESVAHSPMPKAGTQLVD